MATQPEQLMVRLRDNDFRKEFLRFCGEALNMACEFCHGAVFQFEYLEGDWRRSLELAMNVGDLKPYIFDATTQSLSNPKIITPGELWEAFEVYLEDECFGISDETYDAYLDHVEHRLVQVRMSEPFTLCNLKFPQGSQKLDYFMHGAWMTQARILGNVSEEEIKASTKALIEDGEGMAPRVMSRIGEFGIVFAGVQFNTTEWRLHKPDPDKSMTGELLVEVSGRSSARAMEALALELEPLARSAFLSAAFLEPEPNADPEPSADHVLDLESFKKYQVFGISCVELAILNTSNKDTFQRRIANAVRLLAEADNQRSDPIGLSLCITAIDALLGRKGPEMTQALADFVAGLLEPEVTLRRQAAECVRDLYDNRSRVLHGDRLEGNSKLRKNARQLAASVLYGVWSYQDIFERFYDKAPKPDDFFGELRKDFVKPGLPVGVLELPVRALWQKISQKGEE